MFVLILGVVLLPDIGRCQSQADGQVSISEMAISADFIFKGTVDSVSYRNSEPAPKINPFTGEQEVDEDGNPAFHDGSDIPHTFVTYSIERVYKGYPPAGSSTQVTLRFEGGHSDKPNPNMTDPDGEPIRPYLLVEQNPLFDRGDRDVLFVRGNTVAGLPLTGRLAGRLRILNDAANGITGGLFLESGEEVRYVPSGRTFREWDVSMGAVHLLGGLLTHKIGDVELELRFDGWAEETEPGGDEEPVGIQFLESVFETYMEGLIGELFTPAQLKELPAVVTADIRQTFTGREILMGHPPDPGMDPVEPGRPWLDDLSEEERAVIFEQERQELEWVGLQRGNPVIPSTDCERQIVLNGPIAGDISGPLGRPDCRVDFYDLALLASNWLTCAEPDLSECP